MSWDESNQKKAIDRAVICKADLASFKVADVRQLDAQNFLGSFDIVINTENIEHILNDKKLFDDMYALLKPGGHLLLTTPYLYYQAISDFDEGPFVEVENGAHVRRGYTEEMLKELCDNSGFKVENISFCSGIISQKLCSIQRILGSRWSILGWASILVFRILPPFFDKLLTRIFNKPYFSICLVAYKPRFLK